MQKPTREKYCSPPAIQLHLIYVSAVDPGRLLFAINIVVVINILLVGNSEKCQCAQLFWDQSGFWHVSLYCFADPKWASYTLGVFVCQICSGLHRNIAQISKVKSILLDPWSKSEVEVRVYCRFLLLCEDIFKMFMQNPEQSRMFCILQEKIRHSLETKAWLEITSAASGLALTHPTLLQCEHHSHQ